MDDHTDRELFGWIEIYQARIETVLRTLRKRHPAAHEVQFALYDYQKAMGSVVFYEKELRRYR